MSTRGIIIFFVVTLSIGAIFTYAGLRPFIFSEARSEILPITSVVRLISGVVVILSLLCGLAAMFVMGVFIRFEFFKNRKKIKRSDVTSIL